MKTIDLETVKNYKPPLPPMAIRKASEMVSDWLDRVTKTPEELHGYPTSCWPGFNDHFGGARSELVTLTGETGRGKTTFAMNWLKDSVDQGRPGLIVSLENGPSDAFDQFSQMITGKDSAETTFEDRKLVTGYLDRWPMWFLDYRGRIHETLMLNVIDYACIELGVKFILIDHLDYIEKKWDRRNDAYVIGDCVRDIAGRAVGNRCTILLVCHPSKLNTGSESREVGMDDLKGSSSIKQESASVITLHRPKLGENLTWVRLAKMRSRKHSRNTGGRIRFAFDARTQTYKETTSFLEWGHD